MSFLQGEEKKEKLYLLSFIENPADMSFFFKAFFHHVFLASLCIASPKTPQPFRYNLINLKKLYAPTGYLRHFRFSSFFLPPLDTRQKRQHPTSATTPAGVVRNKKRQQRQYREQEQKQKADICG
jgi:hypothetical protein